MADPSQRQKQFFHPIHSVNSFPMMNRLRAVGSSSERDESWDDQTIVRVSLFSLQSFPSTCSVVAAFVSLPCRDVALLV